MKFNTTLNDAVVAVEYDELTASDDGLVYECEVTYNGQIVDDLVSGADYAALLMECESHYRKHCEAEREVV